MDDNTIGIIFVTGFTFLCLGLAINYDDNDKIANSPELRKCLSQSGTTWQGGECIIILNK